MPPLQGSFDATQFAPKQVGESHPVGKFPFKISNTEIAETKDKDGGMLVVTFRTPVGEIASRYNLWNKSAKAVEIAHGQLSALCYATGIFKVDWSNEGAALRNGEGMIEVGWQKGQEPSTENPNGGYTEVKKVYDRSGNEPGKAPAQPQPQSAQPQQQPGWGAGQQQPQGNGNAPGWGNSPANTVQQQPQQPVQQPVQPPQTQQPASWQPGPANPNAGAPQAPWRS
jgi:hypothetical protein